MKFCSGMVFGLASLSYGTNVVDTKLCLRGLIESRCPPLLYLTRKLRRTCVFMHVNVCSVVCLFCCCSGNQHTHTRKRKTQSSYCQSSWKCTNTDTQSARFARPKLLSLCHFAAMPVRLYACECMCVCADCQGLHFATHTCTRGSRRGDAQMALGRLLIKWQHTSSSAERGTRAFRLLFCAQRLWCIYAGAFAGYVAVDAICMRTRACVCACDNNGRPEKQDDRVAAPQSVCTQSG